MQREDMLKLSRTAKVDFRTVKRAYAGEKVRQLSMDRIQATAKEMGYVAPGKSLEDKNLETYELAVGQSFGRYLGDASPPMKWNPLLGGNIRPSTKAYLELPITVQHNWDAYSYVNNALQRLAEAGIYQDAAMLVDAVRGDDRVIGCLSTRVNALFGLPMEFKWQGQDDEHASAAAIAAPGADGGEHGGTQHVDQGDKERPEVADLKQRICRLVEDNWNKMLPAETMKELVGWGVMINLGLGELVWAWDGDIVFPTIKSWHPQFVYWRWDTRSNHLIHQGGTTEIAPGDGRWVTFCPNGHNHGWVYGLIRALGPLWLDRKFLWRDWARASEKFAVGIIKAYEPSNAPDPDKNAFAAATTNMVAESTVRLPRYEDGKPGFDLEMLATNESSVNTDAFFETRIKRIDICIAVCLLGQNLSTEVSGAGSRAAAQVHENVRADFLRADADVLKQVISDQIISPFVRYNFEAEAEALGINWKDLVPEVSWTVDPPADLEKEANAIAKIAQAIPQLAGTEADIHRLLDKHNIPVLDEKQSPDIPPPTPGLNPARPRGPGGTVGVPPPGLGDEPRPDGSDQQPLEVEQQYMALRRKGWAPEDAKNIVALRKSTFGNRSSQGLKPGSRAGQVYVDDLADAARKAGARAMRDRVEKLLEIVKASKSYDEVRDRVKATYRELPPGELRHVVERAIVLAEMVGLLSAREDTRP
jgi:phage gp29-like protein